ncbi:hypothetical protein K505DRAFT_374775 [Melanomma pulvis-pyrius CBS 109.77]|uniref:C2H2-type domain-containing protein n=1 Tax=Melanomma pulvis-pyrius CBS 109.77 TaxID=1314802 RepID=A0A6A6XCQ1_9PLEO|nr:hypothetical protein K505DRAFT_374775 [Melanomma pulvis-pyrius CBS 109.77]
MAIDFYPPAAITKEQIKDVAKGVRDLCSAGPSRLIDSMDGCTSKINWYISQKAKFNKHMTAIGGQLSMYFDDSNSLVERRPIAQEPRDQACGLIACHIIFGAQSTIPDTFTLIISTVQYKWDIVLPTPTTSFNYKPRMWVQGVCNLLATLSKPPWTKPLNWSLQMTLQGEERIPYHLYVQSYAVQPRSSSQPSSFPEFNQLPAELQLRILTFCSAPTLYRIMRTSSMLRIEAAKLFWADQNTYYLIEAYWLFGGGHSGYTCYDLSFMAYVQNVEIEYDVIAEDKIGPVRDDVLEIDYEKARDFWKTFKTRFPRAKTVVVNQNWESVSIRQQDDDEPVACCLKVLIEVCPVEIDVFAFVLVEVGSGGCKRTALPVANNWHRVLYQLTKGGGWKKVTTSGFERKTILIPPKRFHGPVGEFEAQKHEGSRIHLQQIGLGALAIEALDRYYFDKEDPEPFHCPVSGCDVYFEKAGQWTQHAAEAHSIHSLTKSGFDILPTALQHIFEERKNSLERESEAVGRKFRKIYNDWNEEGGKKRKELERGWIYQLENDEAWYTGTKGTESKLWEWFTTVMDPTWVGQ